MFSLFAYFRDSFAELSLVTWPKQEKLIGDTLLCIVFVVIAAVILGGIDFGFLKSYEFFLTLAP